MSVIYVDIDNTICTQNEIHYSDAKPIRDNIKIVNDLYDAGNTIVYWTARGTKTGINHRELTEQQFKSWGVKYHELKFNKPAYDLFIDDKAINSVNNARYFLNDKNYSSQETYQFFM